MSVLLVAMFLWMEAMRERGGLENEEDDREPKAS